MSREGVRRITEKGRNVFRPITVVFSSFRNEIKIAGNDCVIDLVQSDDNIVIAAVSDDTLQVWECF